MSNVTRSTDSVAGLVVAVLPIMEAQGSGHIINTASTGAHAVGA